VLVVAEAILATYADDSLLYRWTYKFNHLAATLTNKVLVMHLIPHYLVMTVPIPALNLAQYTCLYQHRNQSVYGGLRDMHIPVPQGQEQILNTKVPRHIQDLAHNRLPLGGQAQVQTLQKFSYLGFEFVAIHIKIAK